MRYNCVKQFPRFRQFCESTNYYRTLADVDFQSVFNFHGQLLVYLLSSLLTRRPPILRLQLWLLFASKQVTWFDVIQGATFRGAEPPTCWTPARLRAKHFDQLTTSDLHCSAPSFGNIDAMLHWQGTGRLRCTATGQPTPTIYWIRPSGIKDLNV